MRPSSLTRFVRGAACLAAACSCLAGRAAPPHILVIVADDAGYADFGFQSSNTLGGESATPHLDALAERGVICTEGHVTASVCSPSRAGLLAGRHQARFGHHNNLTGKGAGLPRDEVTIADQLSAAGYRTYAVGKWHLGSDPGFEPQARGFDEFAGMLSGSRSYWPMERPRPDKSLQINGESIDEPSEVGYVTDWLSGQAVRLIDEHGKEHGDQPLFMYLSYTAPHTPMHATEAKLRQFPHVEDELRRTYLAMLSSMDDGVGATVDALRRNQMLDDTLVFFLSDNGGATNNGSDNGALRGMKGSVWEGGTRVPFLVVWPGVAPAGQRYDGLLSTLDILPTALAAAGAESIADEPLGGVDLAPYLTGECVGSPHSTLMWKRSTVEAIRRQDASGDHKLIRLADGYRVMVDLVNDPAEVRDVLSAERQSNITLTHALDRWCEQLVEPLWLEGEPWETNVLKKHRIDATGRATERRLP